jgi:hypothetical protein
MVDNLEKGELYMHFRLLPTDFWKTSKGKWNKNITNEKEFYLKIKWANIVLNSARTAVVTERWVL